MTTKKAKEFKLTELQQVFLNNMKNDTFYEQGLDSVLWVDIYLDTLEELGHGRMTMGAIVSTLKEKGVINITSGAREKRKDVKAFYLSALGQLIMESGTAKIPAAMPTATPVTIPALPPEAPVAPPAAEKPAAPIGGRKSSLTVELVKKRAMSAYEKGGDAIIECWTDEDIAGWLDDNGRTRTVKELNEVFKANYIQRKEVEATRF